MANACDDYEQPEIDYLFNAADAISEAVNRAASVEALKVFEAAVIAKERARCLLLIEAMDSEFVGSDEVFPCKQVQGFYLAVEEGVVVKRTDG